MVYSNRHLQKRGGRERGEIIDIFFTIIDFIFYYWRCLMEKEAQEYREYKKFGKCEKLSENRGEIKKYIYSLLLCRTTNL